MNERAAPLAYSRLSVRSQTVIPKAVREALAIGPGDVLRYARTKAGILIEKATPTEIDDPFAVFTEWATEADEKAYANLEPLRRV